MHRRCRLASPLLLLMLFGCGPGDIFGPARGQFAPACPSPRLIPSLADVTRYAGPGPTHDVTDLILQGRVVRVDGTCRAGVNPAIVPATVRITLVIQRGPAMHGRDADLPVFLAITEGDNVRDKQIFPVHIAFPPNVDQVTITSPDISLDLPVGGDVSGASYGLIAGFQLTGEELKANRRPGGTE